MIISEEKLLQENKFIQQSPQYIRKYEKFFRLLKMFSNYIMQTSEAFEKMISQINLNNSTGVMLEKLANLLDISLMDKSDENYYEKLKIAIIGEGIKRTSKASRYQLSEQLKQLFPGIDSYTITDYSCLAKTPLPMNINIKIIGIIKALDIQILENYVFPKITGVSQKLNYIEYGKDLFAFDSDKSLKDPEYADRNFGEVGWDKGVWAKINSK